MGGYKRGEKRKHSFIINLDFCFVYSCAKKLVCLCLLSVSPPCLSWKGVTHTYYFNPLKGKKDEGATQGVLWNLTNFPPHRQW